MQRNSKANTFLRTFFSRGIIIKISVLLAIIFIVGALFAPVISSYDPNAIDLHITLQNSTPDHVFGTDAQGLSLIHISHAGL